MRVMSGSLSFLLLYLCASCGGEPNAPERHVATVIVSPASDSLIPGTTLQLTAVTKDPSGEPLTGRAVVWSSSDSNVADVSTTGLALGRKPGEVSISARAEGITGMATIKVLVPVASISVTPESSSIAVGSVLQLAASMRDSTGAVIVGRSVSWTSGDPSRLSVSESGVARGIAAADVVVTARSGNASGTSTIRIIGPIVSVVVTPNRDTVVLGDSVQMKATPRDAAGHARVEGTVNWSTSGYRAMITPSGVVLGVAGGEANITATVDGVAGSGSLLIVMDTVPVVVQSTAGRTCSLSLRGTIYCWGGIVFPVPGITTGDDLALIPAPVRVPTTLIAAKMSVGHDHTCILTSTGTAHCWGSNMSGQLGNDTISHICTAGYFCAPLPAPVLGGLTFASLGAGYQDTCGLTSSGVAYCWGGNVRGEVGDGSSTPRSLPTQVAAALLFQSISVGWYHTCGITTDSLAYCWGDNSSGQLGIGTTDDVAHTTPQPVAGEIRFAVITTGAFHSCAITGTGVAYCWGRNSNGQLGAGSSPVGCSPGTCNTPVEVEGSLSFSSVSAGEWHTCGVTRLEEAYCWGLGTSYQLGNDSPGDIPTPVLVQGSLKWASVSAGEVHTCGLTVGRVAYCWGGNTHALGNGTADSQGTPGRVLGQP